MLDPARAWVLAPDTRLPQVALPQLAHAGMTTKKLFRIVPIAACGLSYMQLVTSAVPAGYSTENGGRKRGFRPEKTHIETTYGHPLDNAQRRDDEK